MAHLKNDDVLHPQELLHKDHAFLALRVFVSIIGLIIQAFHDVVLEVLEQIHLGLDVLRVNIHGMTLANEHTALASGCDEVKVTTKGLAISKCITDGRPTAYQATGR